MGATAAEHAKHIQEARHQRLKRPGLVGPGLLERRRVVDFPGRGGVGARAEGRLTGVPIHADASVLVPGDQAHRPLRPLEDAGQGDERPVGRLKDIARAGFESRLDPAVRLRLRDERVPALVLLRRAREGRSDGEACDGEQDQETLAHRGLPPEASGRPRPSREPRSAHPELPLQVGRRGRVLEDQLLVRVDVAVRLLRGERRLVEAATGSASACRDRC